MEKTKYTCSKKISFHVMIAFWITQFFSQNLTQERDLKYKLSKCTQRKKKYDQKSAFWVGNSVLHSPILFGY